MNPRHVTHVTGFVLVAMAAGLAATALVALYYREGDAAAFGMTAAGSALAGSAAIRYTSLERDLSVREGYAVVSVTWITVGVVGAVPFLLTGVLAAPDAALFESVSGFTTTGATVFGGALHGNIEALPRGILFWRSLTQWLGGMGIILLGIAILPFLGVGGMRLFQAEVPGPTYERLAPRIAQTAKLLWYVYGGLTVALVALLLLGGMGPYDAVTHAFTTMPTGGFSPRDASLAAFDSAFLHYVVILFMYLAGASFALHFRAVTRGLRTYTASPEWRFYTGVLLAGSAALLASGYLGGDFTGLAPERAVRDSLFQAVSIGTTTGYATSDYGGWVAGSQLLLLLLMFGGGMAGSTGGGMKAVRVLVLFRHGLTELRKGLHPRAVILTRIGRQALDEAVLLKILAFVLLYLALFALGALLLACLGHDPVTAIGASAATIGNIGPGLGQVGPVENFAGMGTASYLVMIFLMVVGRLEIFTVLLLFHPDLWKRNRGRGRGVRGR